MALTMSSYRDLIRRSEPTARALTPRSESFVRMSEMDGTELILINVAAYDYSDSPHRCIQHNLRPPIGLYSLQAAVQAAGADERSVRLLDMERERMAPVDVAAFVAKIQSFSRAPLMVGLNGYSPNRALVEKVAHAIHEWAPETKLILGGRLLSIELDPRRKTPVAAEECILSNIAEFRDVCGIVGEGERLLPWLFKLKDWGQSTVCVEPAMAWSSPTATKLATEFESLATNDLTDINFDPPTYVATGGGGHPYYAMLSSRSCPFHCSFCAANYFPVRVLPVSFIENQIRSLAQTKETVRIDFCDDNVLMNQARAQEIIEMMERLHHSGVNVIWRALARADSVRRLDSKGYVARAANAGLEEVAMAWKQLPIDYYRRCQKGLSSLTSMPPSKLLATVAFAQRCLRW